MCDVVGFVLVVGMLCALLLNLMRLSGLFVLWCVVVSGVRVCEFVCVLVCCLCGLFCCA